MGDGASLLGARASAKVYLWKEKASPWVPKVSLTGEWKQNSMSPFIYFTREENRKQPVLRAPIFGAVSLPNFSPAPRLLSPAGGNLTILLIYANEHLWFLIPDGPLALPGTSYLYPDKHKASSHDGLPNPSLMIL